jgi:hypothetical protein
MQLSFVEKRAVQIALSRLFVTNNLAVVRAMYSLKSECVARNHSSPELDKIISVYENTGFSTTQYKKVISYLQRHYDAVIEITKNDFVQTVIGKSKSKSKFKKSEVKQASDEPISTVRQHQIASQLLGTEYSMKEYIECMMNLGEKNYLSQNDWDNISGLDATSYSSIEILMKENGLYPATAMLGNGGQFDA